MLPSNSVWISPPFTKRSPTICPSILPILPKRHCLATEPYVRSGSYHTWDGYSSCKLSDLCYILLTIHGRAGPIPKRGGGTVTVLRVAPSDSTSVNLSRTLLKDPLRLLRNRPTGCSRTTPSTSRKPSLSGHPGALPHLQGSSGHCRHCFAEALIRSPRGHADCFTI